MHKSGEVLLAKIPFTDQMKIKKRPVLVLFEEKGNLVTAGITSNVDMDGVPLSVEEGAVRESIIKLNYIFTISERMIDRSLFELTKEKKKRVYEELNKRLKTLRKK